MQTLELIDEIDKLSLDKKFFVIEHTLKSIKREENKLLMDKAVNILKDDYLINDDLTSFKSIDLDEFYEAR
ncbi:MAG: hypothetical protein MUF45_16435 [Spirosomaceae bacterium]|jgi:hypothetical protein|nr:hypothetical protein [Spirosomataceae bacterium]